MMATLSIKLLVCDSCNVKPSTDNQRQAGSGIYWSLGSLCCVCYHCNHIYVACVASEGRVVAAISVFVSFFSVSCLSIVQSQQYLVTTDGPTITKPVHHIQCLWLFGVTQKLILLYTWIEVLGL